MQLHETQSHHAPASLKAIVLAFALVLVGVLGYLVWNENALPNNFDSGSTIIKTKTADWKKYENSEFSYSIKYPTKQTGDTADWQAKSMLLFGDNHLSRIGFGINPYVKNDVWYFTWVVDVYGKAATVDELIDQIDFDLKGRDVKKTEIMMGPQSATLATVTSTEKTDRVHKQLFIETEDIIYVVGNGGMDSNGFTAFYGSFALTK